MSNFIQANAKQLNINAVIKQVGSATKVSVKTLEALIEAGKLITEGLSWWNSTGKELAEAEGTKLNAEQFAKEVYGMSKGYMYKLQRASALPISTIEAYKMACDESDANGGRAVRSIEALLQFAKNEPEESTEDGEGEGEEKEAEVKQKPIVTFTCRLTDLEMSDKNVSLRIDAEGNVVTTASADDIAKAIAVLTNALAEANKQK
jgi:hypothetical protein